MNTLTSVKRDLERGVEPRVSIMCPSLDPPLPPRATATRKKSVSYPSVSSSSSAASSIFSAPCSNSKEKNQMLSLNSTVEYYERFIVYENELMYYIVAADRHYSQFRLLSLDRTVEKPQSLKDILHEDSQLYRWDEMEAKLQELFKTKKKSGMLESNGSMHSGRHGKLVRVLTAVGIVGCVRFLRGYYMIFVTQRRKVGCIGGNVIYGVQATQQISITRLAEAGTGWAWFQRWFNPSPEEEAEARYLGLFHFIDLTKDFYYSYSYDLTRMLQYNMTAKQREPAEMFVWNHHLTRELTDCLSEQAATKLVMPYMLGCYEQRKCSVFGRMISIILIARRSRHFAGTRYLKRGIADTGKVANDVEIEQIIEDESMGMGKFSSFVQHRGSIPVYWSQETSATLPKPPIVLNRVDPTYTACKKHTADLFRRYGSPIIALNLVKQTEKKERETIVGNEYMNAVEYLNSFMPSQHRIRYVALDYSRLSKQKGLNVLHSMDKFAVWALTQTGFFCSAPKHRISSSLEKPNVCVWLLQESNETESQLRSSSHEDPFRQNVSACVSKVTQSCLEQRGVLRTNCIDCLDRTNVSQFSVGMRALGQQLYVMGIRNTPLLESRSQLVRVLMLLYSLVGDAISMQYGGSEAHKNVKNGAGRENLKHRELLTSIRRYYSNSFTDTAKQDAINIFLGNYIPDENEIPLWELESDYYLHNFEVKNGIEACEKVQASIALLAEKKKYLLQSCMQDPASDGCELLYLKKALEFNRENKEIRLAYVKECKRLLDDWWKEPLAAHEALKADAVTYMTPRQTDHNRQKNHEAHQSNRANGFAQRYHPRELTSFDKLFSYKYMSPLDLSKESSEDGCSISSDNKGLRRRSDHFSRMSASELSDGSSEPSNLDSDQCADCDLSTMRRSLNNCNTTTRTSRSMSAPDISEDSSKDCYLQSRKGQRHLYANRYDATSLKTPFLTTLLHNETARHTIDRSLQFSKHLPRKSTGSTRALALLSGHSPHLLKLSKEKDLLETSTTFEASYHNNKNRHAFVGDRTSIPDSIYELYVYWSRSQSLWEMENENVKMYFEEYLRDNNIDTNDVRAIRNAQIRGGATFKIESGVYAGLDQHIKARVTVSRKLKIEAEDQRLYEKSFNMKSLSSLAELSVSTDSAEYYKSFYDDPLPELDIYARNSGAVRTMENPQISGIKRQRQLSCTLSSESATNESFNTHCTKTSYADEGSQSKDISSGTPRDSAVLNSIGAAKTPHLSRLKNRNLPVLDELISVGPLYKLSGGKDQDFILFNESAAENGLALVMTHEAALSFYAK